MVYLFRLFTYSFTLTKYLLCSSGFPGCKAVKNSPANAGDSGDTGSTWAGKMPWRRKWKPNPYSYWNNSMDREAWQATVHGVTRVGHDRARARTHTHTHTHTRTHALCSRYCCRKGDHFQGLKLGYSLTLRSELSKETQSKRFYWERAPGWRAVG